MAMSSNSMSQNEVTTISLYYNFTASHGASLEWHRVLAIPAELCVLKSPSPVKWLRYIAGIVCGREGHLHHATPVKSDDPCSQSSVTEGPQLTEDEYSARSVDAIGTRFCYLPTDRLKPLLWADPQACHRLPMDNDDSDASLRDFAWQSRRKDRRVLERDEWHCVLTGAPEHRTVLQTFHLISNLKGPQYIANAERYRLERDMCELGTIKDPRNKLTLIDSVVVSILRSKNTEFILLPVPNFAMGLSDVYEFPPPADTDAPENLTQYARMKNETWSNQRLQFQILDYNHLPFFLEILGKIGILHENTDLRLPRDLSTFPPAWLLELFSASMMLEKYGCDDFVLANNIRNVYSAAPGHAACAPSHSREYTEEEEETTRVMHDLQLR